MIEQPRYRKVLNALVKCLPFVLLFLVALIPVYYTHGKLATGGDTILPFGADGIKKFLWQWYDSGNGQYLSQNLAPLYLIYKIAGYFSLSLATISAVIFFGLNFIAGLAIYKLSNLIYRPRNTVYLAFPVIFYLLSPAVLNGWHYCFIYAFAPWFIFFVTKILMTRQITIIDLILSNIVIFFASVDLPNPKYLFFLYLSALVVLIMALLIRIINLRSILKNWWKIILFFLFSFYLLLPLAFFALNYTPEGYGVHIRQNYSDSGQFMDQGSSTIDRMVQLHHNGENINSGERKIYNNSNKIVVASSVFFVCILLGLFLTKKNTPSKIELIFLVAICLFLFFAVGPNPPLGFIYIAVVSNIGLLAFLRTTAGAVFFLSIFYSILLFGFIEKFNHKYKLPITILLFGVLLATSYPLVDGKFYENLDIVGNRTIDKKSYGVNIPTEYFEIKKLIDQKKIDGKLLNLKNDLSYMNTNWGYFGPSVYNYLFNFYNIGYDNIFSRPENHSVAYTLDDKSLIVDKTKPIPKVDKSVTLADNNLLNLRGVSPDDFLPHFWIPSKSYREDKLLGDLSTGLDNKPLGEAVYLTGQNKADLTSFDNLPETTLVKPTIEYKKINPTKYRLIIHRAETVFPLILNEAFNNNWKIYPVKYQVEDKSKLLAELDDYQIIKDNDDFQASKNEVGTNIGQGLISSLSANPNVRGSRPDFVSKDMFGTIQNDNLKTGSSVEALFRRPILNNDRLVANGYANSWLVDPKAVCGQSNFCHQNADGSYDFETVVEFTPQRVFWLGLITTLIAIFFGSFALVIAKIKKIKRKI